MNKLFILFALLFILITNIISAQELVVIKNSKKVIELSKQVSVLEDVNSIFSIKDILKDELQNQFKQNYNKTLSLGFSQSSFWIKFSVLNQQKEYLALQISNVLIDTAQLYIIQDKKIILFKQAGLFIPFKNRDINTNSYIFNLPLSQDIIQDIYIKVNSRLPMDISTFIGSKDMLLEQNANNKFIHGVYFGFILLIICYNLFIYSTVKDIDYLFYVFSCFCVGLSFLVNQGYLYQFLYPNNPFINISINYITVTCFTIIANIIFSMYFLRIRHYFNISYYIAISLIILLSLLIILNVIGYTKLTFVSSQFLLLIIAILGVSIPYYIYKKGFKPAMFFLLAWIGIILGGVIDILKANQFLPINEFTNNAYRIGTALEMLLLSFALADKINFYKKSKIEAQEANLFLIKENLELAEKNIYLVKEQNVILEAKVKERTTELQSANREILEQNEELHAQEREFRLLNKELVIQKSLIEIQNTELQNTSYRLNTSIRYAQHIQELILPEKSKLDNFFAEHFTIFLPKDTVSGDFYWFTEIGGNNKWKKENQDLLQSINPNYITYKSILTMIDCTGHGVPGAFMTMIVHTLLHEIVEIKKTINPAFILQNLHSGIKNLLKQYNGKNSDGMDISVCYFEKDVIHKTYKVTFAGAKGLAFYVENNEIKPFKSERYSIGGTVNKKRTFTNQEVTLKEGTFMYFMTDGYIDQNNVERRKFGSNNFKALLSNLFFLPIKEQEEEILFTLKEHQGNEEQRDDISIVGIKL
ncbi:MAG: hypothetical protein EAZ08_07425 [Cytophagales bacterium]|nr:MAG: hypothetical protein EAZ08_07425 [Cytophagales bacterium]